MSRSQEVEPLEDRLVAAALHLLQDHPAERLSLRAVAHHVEVSHQAPYVYFANKRVMLAAVAGAGLQHAAQRAAEAVAAARTPTERLHALVDAYVAFVREQPHVHDLAFGPLVKKSDHPRLEQSAKTYWDQLHDVVAACQPHGVGEAEVLGRCVATWGTVQGISRLQMHGQIPASVPAPLDDLVHGAVETLRRGWQAGNDNPGPLRR
ncbi:MAG: TetR family transcriptional regulator [Nitriliruptorales bacterium]|nr:TetR family transcriptional regulator [Nitriliruptorales bacterium]